MLAYLAITICSVIPAIAGNYLGKYSKVIKFVAIAVSAFVFCFFAGARGLSVGSDTAGYGLQSYYEAHSMSLQSFYFGSTFREWSPLFKLLCWFSSAYGSSVFWYFFAIQLATVIPLYFAIYRGLDHYGPYGVLVYGIVFFPMSFNMMRQMISMSFLLLAIIEANDRKPIRFLAWILVAMGFHNSALIGIYLYPIIYYTTTARGRFSQGPRAIIFVLFNAILIAAAPQILSLTDSLGFYSAYTSGASVTAGGGARTIALTFIVMVVIYFIGAVLSKGSGKATRLSEPALAAVVGFGLICLPLSLISLWLYRIGFYFLYASILAIPNCACLFKDRAAKVAFFVLCGALLAFWSYDYYVIQGSHQVVPYLFGF